MNREHECKGEFFSIQDRAKSYVPANPAGWTKKAAHHAWPASISLLLS